ncbi:MAG: PHP domain-containing protein [Bacillota bacterium]
MFADLHIHTNASDGTWGVPELLESIKKSLIGLFSVTDHDTVENTGAAAAEAAKNGVFYLPGVEIACAYREKEYHLVAYGIDASNRQLSDLMSHNRNVREDYNTKIVKFTESLDSRISLRQYREYRHDPGRGGWKVLNFLLDKGIIGGLPEYFTLVQNLKETKLFKEPQTAIRIIKAAGGVPFLAHPNANYNGGTMPEEELMKWAGFGIDGVECYSSYNAPGDERIYLDFCRRNHLLISGGSDCHGSFLPKKLGEPPITLEMLNLGNLFQK